MSNLALEFTKLDKRHTGYLAFEYYATIRYKGTNVVERLAGYFKLRQLCTEAFGLSCERDLYLKAIPWISSQYLPGVELNKHWAWHTDLNNAIYRIYLSSDEERAWLLLKW